MTKADVISEIAEKTGVDKADVTATVESFFVVVKNSMAEGNDIFIRGFGSFINKKKARKIGRNISKNTTVVIPSHFIPAFKPAKTFSDRVKRNVKTAEPEPKNND
ncbi:MAG: HU family DNA-binding protein [Cytophagaceae bacterium]